MTRKLLSFILAASVVAGCTFPNVVSPYKLDVPQGNAVTADQVARLKPGMTRSQVRFVLGTPLLADPFHANRWDYIFTDARDGKLQQQKTFTIIFEGDKLISFSGDTLPAAKPILTQSASTPANATSAPAIKKD